ncbi:MAG: hypothetical protein O3C40_33900 [Planctomycetota bacterium]|nr:hypothetical protein [Planctomycetota bacterium]
MKIDARPMMIVVLICTTVAADEPVTKLRRLIDDSVAWYEVFPSEESTEPMKPIVVMRWPNSVRGSTDGASVLWIANGRPEAVAAIYPWEGRLFMHEFDSLSRSKVVAKRNSQVVWRPTTAGLQFRLIADVPAPAPSSAARLRQMKALTKEFNATLLGWAPDNSQREELRMMSRPLYRYEIDKPDKVLDGALFAYATGTDPEVMLVIEAFGEAGVYRWQYAFVRSSSGALEGRFRDQLMWSADRYPPKDNPTLNHVEFSRPLDEALESVESKATP